MLHGLLLWHNANVLRHSVSQKHYTSFYFIWTCLWEESQASKMSVAFSVLSRGTEWSFRQLLCLFLKPKTRWLLTWIQMHIWSLVLQCWLRVGLWLRTLSSWSDVWISRERPSTNRTRPSQRKLRIPAAQESQCQIVPNANQLETGTERHEKTSLRWKINSQYTRWFWWKVEKGTELHLNKKLLLCPELITDFIIMHKPPKGWKGLRKLSKCNYKNINVTLHKQHSQMRKNWTGTM